MIMKPLKNAVLLSTLIASSFAFADVTIKIPSNVEVLSVNEGKPKIEGGLFSSHKTLELADGTNQLVFKYEAAFDQGDDRHFVTSDTIITRFEAHDQTLTFDMPKYRDINIAKENIKSLDWKLVNESGKKIEVVQDKLMKDGMQIGRDYRREAEDYNRAGGIAAISTMAAVAPTTVVAATQVAPVAASNTQMVKPATVPAVASDNTAEEMLYFWYQKADQATKDKFKAYINQ